MKLGNRVSRWLSLAVVLTALLSGSVWGQGDERILPGSQGYLLPNGWTLTPAGRQIELGDLPMRILVEPTGRHAFVLNSGWDEHMVTVIDLGTGEKIQK